MKYANSISIRLSLLLFILFAGCIVRPVFAINKYAGIALPDNGLGSRTRGLTKVGAGTLGVVGSKNKADGTFAAVYWFLTPDPQGPIYVPSATDLPAPAGSNSEATGIAFLQDDPNQPIIVGYTGTTLVNQGVTAVMWRRNAAGQFMSTVLDDNAEANGVTVINSNTLGLIIVVCGRYQLANGNFHACLWRVGMQGVQRTDLGTLGGPNSNALSINTGAGADTINVTGNAQRASGRMLAASWSGLMEEEGIFYFIKPLPTPNGAESNAVYVSGANGGVWKTNGFISGPNGRRSASLWINQGATPNSFVSTLYRDLFGNVPDSTANGIVGDWNGDGRDLMVVGTARNSRTQRGVGAFPFNPPFDNRFRFDTLRSQDTVLDWNSIALGAVERQGAIAGEALIGGLLIPQAMVFVPTNEEVPQIIAILIGYQTTIGPNIYDFWQRDGNTMTLRPNRQGGMLNILAEWGSTSVSNSAREPRRLMLASRIMPRNANVTPSAMLNLQLFDSSAGQWVNVATRILSSDEFFHQVVIDIPNPAQFAVAGGGPLRWRLGLSGNDWRDWEIDLLEMKTR